MDSFITWTLISLKLSPSLSVPLSLTHIPLLTFTYYHTLSLSQPPTHTSPRTRTLRNSLSSSTYSYTHLLSPSMTHSHYLSLFSLTHCIISLAFSYTPTSSPTTLNWKSFSRTPFHSLIFLLTFHSSTYYSLTHSLMKYIEKDMTYFHLQFQL